MKKILITLILLLTFSLYSSFTFAQENLSLDQNEFSSKAACVEYELPYPGILPDSPLYFFKNIRDRIVGLFISDPLKKAEYQLLQADKMLNAGYYLSQKQVAKNDLIASTLLKAEDYFEKTINQIKQAKEQGIDINSLLEKTILSSQKHQELLIEVENKISEDSKKTIKKELKRSQNFEKIAREIKAN